MDTRCSVCCVVLIPLEDSQGNAAAEQSYLTLSGYCHHVVTGENAIPVCRLMAAFSLPCLTKYVVTPNSVTVCSNNISYVHVNLQPESQIILKHP